MALLPRLASFNAALFTDLTILTRTFLGDIEGEQTPVPTLQDAITAFVDTRVFPSAALRRQPRRLDPRRRSRRCSRHCSRQQQSPLRCSAPRPRRGVAFTQHARGAPTRVVSHPPGRPDITPRRPRLQTLASNLVIDDPPTITTPQARRPFAARSIPSAVTRDSRLSLFTAPAKKEPRPCRAGRLRHQALRGHSGTRNTSHWCG